MNCIHQLPKNGVNDALVKMIPNNSSYLYKVYAYANKDSEFTEGFTNWYKKTTGRAISPTSKAKTVAKYMIRYYDENHLNVSKAGSKKSSLKTEIDDYGYTSVTARVKGVRHLANAILRKYAEDVAAGTQTTMSKKLYYTRHLANVWNNAIFEYAASLNSKTNIEELKQGYEEATDKTAYMKKILGNKELDTIAQNLLAVYKEMNSGDESRENLINKILEDSRLQVINREIKNDTTPVEESEPVDVEDTDGMKDLSKPGDDSKDETFKQYNHFGEVSDAMQNTDQDLQLYFNTLPKIIDASDPSNITYDKDDYFGMADTMDATNCVSVLFSLDPRARVSLTAFMEAVKQISERLPEYASFRLFYDKMKTDSNFANKVFTTFGRVKVDKVQYNVDNEVAKFVVSNKDADKKRALEAITYNSLVNTLLYCDMEAVSNRVKENITKKIKVLQKRIEQVYYQINNDNRYKRSTEINGIQLSYLEGDEFVKLYNEVKGELIKELRYFVPNISEAALNTYIESKFDGVYILDKAERYEECIKAMDDLVSILNTFIKHTKQAQQKYDEYLTVRRQYIINEKYNDLSTLDTPDIVDNQVASAMKDLVDLVSDYCVVPVKLNHANSERNQSSDIINNSMISYIQTLVDQTQVYYTDEHGARVDHATNNKHIENSALVEWAENKLRTGQYEYSTFLLEQRDENGNVLSKGLFRRVGESLELTDDPRKYFHRFLFDGATNNNNGENKPYYKMTKGDYLPIVYSTFFKPIDGTHADDTANYFPRTPADAKNQYCITMQKHNTDGLTSISDLERVDSDIEEMIYGNEEDGTGIKGISSAKFAYDYRQGFITNSSSLVCIRDTRTGNPISIPNICNINYDTIASILTGNKTSITTFGVLPKQVKEAIMKMGQSTNDPNDKRKIYYFALTDNDTHNITQIIAFKADFNPSTASFNKGELVGYVHGVHSSNSLDSTIDLAMRQKFMDMIKHGDVTYRGKTYAKAQRRINRNHSVFELYRRQFKQEMIDAMNACATLFKIDSDGYIHGTNTPINKILADSGIKPYMYYHTNKDGKIGEPIKRNGTIVGYNLFGNVFHSSKFTVTKEVDGKLVNVNYLDKLISFEYATEDDGLIHFFYGGGEFERSIQVTRNRDLKNRKLVLDIAFSKSVQEKIDNAIEEYLNDYIDDYIKDFEEYKSLAKGVYEINDDKVIDFAINYNLAMYNYDVMFEGNPKFYKDPQTLFKRQKEFQGAGVPLGIADYTRSSAQPSMTVDSELTSNPEYKDLFAKHGLGQNGVLELRTKFRAITVFNSIVTNTEALNQLKKKLIEECHTPENVANAILYGIDGKTGYQNTKVNDAQSYITFDEWIRRITAKGMLKQYMPLIKRILDESRPIRATDLQAFIQVQKNYYYDQHVDEGAMLDTPRQIKNAELVLIPRLIRGTELEKVYNFMKESNVDQLNTIETSKASNTQPLTLWDKDGNLNAEKDFIKKANEQAEEFDYNFLYVQLETPQHNNSENKAGIQFIKKIIDNLPADNKLKQDFVNCYLENILESHEDFLDSCGVERDENGNIKFDENGNIKGFDSKLFLDKLRDEMLRLGANENLLHYCTINPETKEPYMQPYMSNTLGKYESIINSVLNNSITRQKLPGSHAAQVTAVGWQPATYRNRENPDEVISKDQYNALSEEDKKKYNDGRVSYNKNLRYHPDGKGYIEVMIPYSFLGVDRESVHYKKLTDEQILKELQDKGLDEFIGYRIPTEGKQSMCAMKVVGFVDDAYGASIVVPYDWVSQTGSDFDIDSVYTVQMSTYKTSIGELRKHNFVSADKLKTDNEKYAAWMNYLKSKATDSRKDIKEIFNSIWGELHSAESKAFDEFVKGMKFKEKAKIGFMRLLADADAGIAKLYEGSDKNTIYQHQIDNKIDTIVRIILQKSNNKLSENQHEALSNLINSLQEIQNYLVASRLDSKSFEGALAEKLDSVKDKLNEVAAKYNLPTFDKYMELISEHPEKLNTRDARNSKITETALSILKSNETLEENLSRSNFEDISYWLGQCMGSEAKLERNSRSPYNIRDQILYQEDATSALQLKGFSVSLDTFCSVCNQVRPTLTKPVKITYSDKDCDIAALVKRFGEDNVKHYEDKGVVEVAHTQYGWSEDNRNVDGRLITAYSSQTTAYILDVIKEGSIPNLNAFTFGVFKTLVNIGSNYKAAVGFILSPGVQAISDAYKRGNSIFATGIKDNYVTEGLRTLAEKAGMEVDFKTSARQIYDWINENKLKEFNNLFGEAKDKKVTDNRNIEFNIDKIIARNKNEGSFKKMSEENKALFDLGIALIYDKLQRISDRVSPLVSVSRADKFGAQQSVFLNDKLFRDIDKLLHTEEYSENEDGVITKDRKSILTVDGKNFIEALYPGITVTTDSNVDLVSWFMEHCNINASKYKSLCAFLKCSTATSIIISRQLLKTQNPDFVDFIYNFQNVLNYGTSFDEKTYNNIRQYTLNYLTANTPMLAQHIEMVNTADGYDLQILSSEDYNIVEEQRRIYGIDCYPGLKYYKVTDGKGEFVPFEVADIAHPTDEELKAFASLSPAQKVLYIQNNAVDAGIFSFVKPQLINPNRRSYKRAAQTLEYNQSNFSDNEAFNLFNIAYNHDNPLVRLTAMDIIKYAFSVEQFKMSQNGAMNFISNEPIFTSQDNGGMGIMDFVASEMAKVGGDQSILKYFDGAKVREDYLRSHPDIPGVRTIYEDRFRNSDFIDCKGVYHLKKQYNTEEEKHALNSKLSSLGVKTYVRTSRSFNTNKYVRIEGKFSNTLYSIVETNTDIFLIPLNNLEPNEHGDFSIKDTNNRYYPKHVYEAIINKYIENQIASAADNSVSKIQFGLSYLESELGNYNSKIGFDSKLSTLVVNPDVYLNNYVEKNGIVIAINNIENAFKKDLTRKTLYFRSDALGQFFTKFNVTEFTIKFTDGTTRRFYITKQKFAGAEEDILRKKIKSPGQVFSKYDSSIINIFASAKDNGLEAINDLYKVEPVKDETSPVEASNDDDVFNSSIEEELSSQISFVNRGVDTAALGAKYAIQRLGLSGGITSLDTQTEAGKHKLELVAREMAAYVDIKVSTLIDSFDHFVEKTSNPLAFYKMTDPEVQELIKNSPELMNKYLNLINECFAFKEIFGPFYQFDDADVSPDIKFYINKIKEGIAKINRLPVNEASNKFAQVYCKQFSTNPLIRQNLMDILDTYYQSYGFMYMFNDVAENGNPLLQVILHDVMNSMEAKRLQSMERIREIEKEIKGIIQEAKEHGVTVDINKLIDGNRWITPASKELQDELDRLKEAELDAEKTYGAGSIEHNKAKHEYDKFKAVHINQLVVPQYYIDKCNIEEVAMKYIPELYSMYKKLTYEKVQLYRQLSEFGNNKEIREKINQINGKIHDLTTENYYVEDGVIKERPIHNPDATYTEEELRRNKIYSDKAVEILKYYINSMRKLNKEYFTYDSEYGFEELVEKYNAIIADYEQRDPNTGLPKYSAEALADIEEYQRAKDWIRNNALYVVESETEDKDNFYARVNAAYRRLNRTVSAIPIAVAKVIDGHNNDEGILDEHGIKDGTKLSEEEREKIRELQQRAYYEDDMPIGSDHGYLSSKGNSDIFIPEFYNKVSGRTGYESPEFKAKYRLAITRYNKLVEQFYDESDHSIHFERIQDNPNYKYRVELVHSDGSSEIVQIDGIELLSQIRDAITVIKELRSLLSRDSHKEFIKNDVEFKINQVAYAQQEASARTKSVEWRNIFDEINNERDENGNVIPNRFLYSYAKPKGEPGEHSYDKWVDKERKEALEFVNNVFVKRTTRYYHQALREAIAKDKADPTSNAYRDFMRKNHVYNPYTRKYEPLSCWVQTEVNYAMINDSGRWTGTWIPKGKQRKQVVKDGFNSDGLYSRAEDKVNHNYNDRVGNSGNYISGSDGGKYDNTRYNELNDYEKKLMSYLKEQFLNRASTRAAERYFKNDYVPARMKQEEMTAKGWIKELGKMFGVATDAGEIGDEWREIGYEFDVEPEMPMTSELKTKETVTIDSYNEPTSEESLTAALEGDRTIRIEFKKPVLADYISDDDTVNERKEKTAKYEEDLQKYRSFVRRINEHNNEISKSLTDNNDWIKAFTSFLREADNYNAIRSNVDKLYYLHNMIKRQKTYLREKGNAGNIKTTDAVVDKKLLEQLETFMHRFIFNEWKEKNTWNKTFAMAQNFTSANYMTLNLRGAVSNIMTGEGAMLAEAAAREFYNAKEYAAAHGYYAAGVIDYLSHMYDDTASTLQGALIKKFQITDFDTISGISREVNIQERLARIRNATYGLLTSGEHMMQNVSMFAMMESHRLIPVDDYGLGHTTSYAIMAEDEYVTYRTGLMLETLTNKEGSSLLTEEQKQSFAEFRKSIAEDAVNKSNYAWFRSDICTKWVTSHLSNEQLKAYNAAKKELIKEVKEEFKQFKNMKDQFELKDGYAVAKEGSILASLQTESIDKLYKDDTKGVTKADLLIADFVVKVRKVNNKIHGVYHRLGAANIEKKAFGSLIMQYHKHLPMGLLKRWKGRGNWNEFRRSVDKGMYASLKDFISLNVDRMKYDFGLNQDEEMSLKSVQNIFRMTLGLLNVSRMSLVYNSMTEYDKANLRRTLNGALNVLGAVAAASLLLLGGKGGGGGDDDNILYNLVLRTLDRHGSESFMYTPIGMISELDTLMSTPLAMLSIVKDYLKVMNELAKMIFEGSSYQSKFQTGRFAGESRLGVYITRRVPLWSGIQGVLDLPRNNRAYNVSGTFNTLGIAKRIAGVKD